jgi:hypothetical protein
MTPAEAPRRDCDAAACECRCSCGSLLARLVDGGVELKCRRCKRTLLLPLAAEPLPRAARRARVLPLGEAG